MQPLLRLSSGSMTETLPPEAKPLMLVAKTVEKLLETREETRLVYERFRQQSEQTISRLTDEIELMRTENIKLEEEKKQVVTVLDAKDAAHEEGMAQALFTLAVELRASGVDTSKYVNERLARLEKLAWGQFDEKIALANQILIFEPCQPTALFLRGHAYYCHETKKDYQRAWKDIVEAYKVKPNDFWIVYYVGLTALKLGDRTQAVTFVERATTLNPGTAANHDSLAATLFELNCFAKAIEQGSKAIALNAAQAKNCPEIIAASKLCQQLEAFPEKNYDAKIAKATEILALQPNQSFALFRRAHSYYYKKQFDLAWEDINKAYKIAPRDYWNVIYVGFTAWERGDRVLGIEFVEKASAISPNRYEPYWNLAKFYFAQGDMAKSRKNALRSLELKSDDPFCKDLLVKIEESLLLN